MHQLRSFRQRTGQNAGRHDATQADRQTGRSGWGLLLLLAADESHFINGSVITADDGLMAQ